MPEERPLFKPLAPEVFLTAAPPRREHEPGPMQAAVKENLRPEEQEAIPRNPFRPLIQETLFIKPTSERRSGIPARCPLMPEEMQEKMPKKKRDRTRPGAPHSPTADPTRSLLAAWRSRTGSRMKSRSISAGSR